MADSRAVCSTPSWNSQRAVRSGVADSEGRYSIEYDAGNPDSCATVGAFGHIEYSSRVHRQQRSEAPKTGELIDERGRYFPDAERG